MSMVEELVAALDAMKARAETAERALGHAAQEAVTTDARIAALSGALYDMLEEANYDAAADPPQYVMRVAEADYDHAVALTAGSDA